MMKEKWIWLKSNKLMQAKVILSDYIHKIFETPSTEGSEWFGYYNYDTLNYDKTKMLCNRAKFDGISPQKELSIELGYYDLKTGLWHHIAYTNSWNWQQGAMMQWIPGEANKNKVIYNCTRNNHNASCIFDIETNEEKEIDWAIYGITPDGKKSIALEMERSHWCRAYHYKSVSNKEWDGRVVEADGIFEIDLDSNSRRRIISIDEIIKTDYKPEFELYKHWLEHIMISPDGSKFCFLHRYSPMNNVMAYKTRVCIADIDGSNLCVLSGTDCFQWSHFGWDDRNRFCIYAYKQEKYKNVPSVSELIKGKRLSISNICKRVILTIARFVPRKLGTILSGRDSYYQYYTSIEGNHYSVCENWKHPFFYIDGHPSFTNGGEYVITDTYPDKSGYQNLTVYNVKTKKAVVLGRFYAHYKGNPASCDLHPKLCKDNNYVAVDTAYNEKHHIILFKLDWERIRTKLA